MIKRLIAIGLLLVYTEVSANQLGEYSSNGTQTWSFSKKLNAQFVEKHNVNYLIVSSTTGETIAEHLIPRARDLSNITWSANGKYLTYIKNGTSLWLLDVNKNSATLIDLNILSDTPLKHAVQWSANGQWMQFLSTKNPDYLTRVYSLKRKRSYLVPVASEQITAITWHDNKNELLINTAQNLESKTILSLYDITVMVNGDAQIAKLNKMN